MAGGKPQRQTKRRKTKQGEGGGGPAHSQSARDRRATIRAASELNRHTDEVEPTEETSEWSASGMEDDTTDALGGTLPDVAPRSADIL